MTEFLDMDEFHLDFKLEDVDMFKDLTNLVDIAINKIEKNIPDAKTYFFVYNQNSRDYREVIKEGLFTIPEDSLFISYLAMRNEIIAMEDLSDEIVINQDEILRFMLSEHLHITHVIPVVYRYRLLGFICLALADKFEQLKPKEAHFLNQLRDTLHVNLYAATLIDNRFNEFLAMTDIAKQVKSFSSYEGLADNILEIISHLIPFEKGVFYEFNEFTKYLEARTTYNIEEKVPNIEYGESISGHVLKKKKPKFIPKLADHIHFHEVNTEDFIKISFISVPLISSQQPFGVITLANNSEDRLFSVDHLYLLRILGSLLVNEMANKILYQQLETSYFETISILAKTLEAKDPYTKGHSERVMTYAEGIALELELSKEKIREIKYAAILHDIGKIGISDTIINKPGSLTKEEYENIQLHTQIGADILDSVQFLKTVKDYVKYHHEKLDGSGYHGKKQGEYPWEATIISVADIFDALTSKRPYRDSVQPEKAFSYLYTIKNVHFEESLLEAFKTYLIRNGILPEGFEADISVIDDETKM